MSAASAAIIRGKGRRVIVVGGGVSGLSAVLELVRSGVSVLHISSGPARQSSSARSQEGIAAALDRSEEQRATHREVSRAAGVGHAGLPILEHLVDQAPRLLAELVALGVPFCREPSGELSRIASVGCDDLPVVFSGDSTGQQVVKALDHQVRALHSTQEGTAKDGVQPRLERLEYWDVIDLILDDHGVSIGVLAVDQRTLELRAFAADAVCLATGGISSLLGVSGTCGAPAAVLGAAIRAGAVLADFGRIAWEPTCLDGATRRPLGSLLRSLGARLWSPKDQDPEQAFDELEVLEREEWPASAVANADTLSKALSQRVARGIPVFLELSSAVRAKLSVRAARVLELIEVFGHVHPRAQSVQVVPWPSGSRGGLWVDCETSADGRVTLDSPRTLATSIPGLYAAGGIEWIYGQLGALPGNRLSAAMLAGRLASAGIRAYHRKIETSAFELPQSVFDHALDGQRARHAPRPSESSKRDGSAMLEIEARLSSLATRIARAQGNVEDWRADLCAVEDDGVASGTLDRARRQSPEHRAVLHSDGLRTVVRTLLESSAAERREGLESGRAARAIMLRWGAEGYTRLDEFEYQSAGKTVVVSAETWSSRSPGEVKADTRDVTSAQGESRDEATT